MIWDEIEVPKELRQFMLDGAEETKLGTKNGSNKQYRYGNLHIREYDDKYLVHMDQVDPRNDPLGHLFFDAPEVLIGLTCAAIAGGKVSSHVYKNSKNIKQASISGLATSIIAGYLSYSITKKIKDAKKVKHN